MAHPYVLAAQWKTYSEAAASVGHVAVQADWFVSGNVFVANSTEGALKRARENPLGRCARYMRDLTARYAPTGLSICKRDESMTDVECHLDYLMKEVGIEGNPETVTGPFSNFVRKCKTLEHQWL